MDNLLKIKVGPWADPYDWSYFSTLTPRQWRDAKSLAKRATQVFADTAYSEFIKSCGPVENAGETLLGEFLTYHEVDFFRNRDLASPGFTVGSRQIDVHTRMLRLTKQIEQYGPMGSCLNTEKFLVMVPELGIARNADIYVFSGFDVDSRSGFLFGWVTREELDDVALSQDSKHTAKCLKITDIHSMVDFLPYLNV